MKNIYEILKEYGMEVPADKKADFDKAWKENYRTKSEYDNAVSQRDNYKASLDDVNAKLKEFEGVDVKDLQGQITKLQGDLKAKDDEYSGTLPEETYALKIPNVEIREIFETTIKRWFEDSANRDAGY